MNIPSVALPPLRVKSRKAIGVNEHRAEISVSVERYNFHPENDDALSFESQEPNKANERNWFAFVSYVVVRENENRACNFFLILAAQQQNIFTLQWAIGKACDGFEMGPVEKL